MEYDTKVLLCSGVTFPTPEEDESAVFSSLIESIKQATEEMNGAVAMNQLKDSILQATKDMKAGFDPAEPRIPQGNSGGGRWTKPGGGSGGNQTGMSAGDITGGDETGRPRIRPRNPMDPVTGPIARGRGDVGGLTEAEAEIQAIRQAEAARNAERLRASGIAKEKLTDHGGIRVGERVFSNKDVEEAIRTAKETGNVTAKIGKYHTLQYIYKGSNGITIHIETQGRNAGKIITLYRH